MDQVVISSEAPHFSGVNIRHELWSEADESRLVSDCDVGVMPLPDEPWTRGKCGLKLLQYMACGLPSIASPVGVNTQIAQDGGVLLAESHQEWIEGIRRLRDPARRQQMGGDARRSVETQWSLQAWVEQVAELYQRLGLVMLELIQVAVTFVLGMGACLYLAPRLADAARRYGIVDAPDGALKTQERPVAYLGGLAVYIAVLLSMALALPFGQTRLDENPELFRDPQVLAMLLSGTLFMSLGLLDDLTRLSVRDKLLGHF